MANGGLILVKKRMPEIFRLLPSKWVDYRPNGQGDRRHGDATPFLDCAHRVG